MIPIIDVRIEGEVVGISNEGLLGERRDQYLLFVTRAWFQFTVVSDIRILELKQTLLSLQRDGLQITVHLCSFYAQTSRLRSVQRRNTHLSRSRKLKRERSWTSRHVGESDCTSVLLERVKHENCTVHKPGNNAAYYRNIIKTTKTFPPWVRVSHEANHTTSLSPSN